MHRCSVGSPPAGPFLGPHPTAVSCLLLDEENRLGRDVAGEHVGVVMFPQLLPDRQTETRH